MKRLATIVVSVSLLLAGCTNASLSDGQSSATYKGVKIFSPTVLSLREGNCAVPSVDAASVVAEPTVTTQNTAGASGQVAASSCTTTIATVNGVNLTGLLNFLETAILGGIAAG